MPADLTARARHQLEARLRKSRLRPSRLRRVVESHPRLWKDELPVADPNTLFDRNRIRELWGHVQRIGHRDRFLLTRMSEPRIAGVRDWEYAVLLGLLAGDGRGERRALDVGSGNSTFPLYLLEHGHVASMTTLDLDAAYEALSSDHAEKGGRVGVRHVQGSMLDLPFEAGSFDLVTCISAIEHLDGSPRTTPVAERPSHDEYLASTATGLREMSRVLAPGGLLYVTTDAFIPERQTTDTWSCPDGKGPIWSAYHFNDIEGTFVATVREAGLELVGTPAFGQELLVDDPDRANYRGRYFTTFALAARRP